MGTRGRRDASTTRAMRDRAIDARANVRDGEREGGERGGREGAFATIRDERTVRHGVVRRG